MAHTPLSASESPSHGARLVYHPSVPADAARLATMATNWRGRTMVVGAAEVYVVLVVLFGLYLAPEDVLVMVTLLVVSTGVLSWFTHKYILKPLACRRKLLFDSLTFWLPPGRTRQFYDAQLSRIDAAGEGYRHTLHARLYHAVYDMRRQERIISGDDALLPYERTSVTNDEARAEYDRLRAGILAEIDAHVAGSEG